MVEQPEDPRLTVNLHSATAPNLQVKMVAGYRGQYIGPGTGQRECVLLT
jgi:hypothetical protein